MATDVRELLGRLVHDRAALVSHDRGARVATDDKIDVSPHPHPPHSAGSAG